MLENKKGNCLYTWKRKVSLKAGSGKKLQQQGMPNFCYLKGPKLKSSPTEGATSLHERPKAGQMSPALKLGSQSKGLESHHPCGAEGSRPNGRPQPDKSHFPARASNCPGLPCDHSSRSLL